MIINYIIHITLILVVIYSIYKVINHFVMYFMFNKAKGVIKEVICKKVGNRVKFRYKIEVSDRNKKENVLLSKVFDQPYIFRPGQEVSVLYSKAEQNKNYILSFRDYWFTIIANLSIPIWVVTFLAQDYLEVFPFIKESELNSAISILFFFVTVFFIVKADSELLRVKKLKENCITVMGRISSFVEEKDHDGQVIKAPRIEFVDIKGNNYSIIGQAYFNNKKKVGEIVEIISDKNYPEFAEVNSFGAIWCKVILFSILSLGFLIFTILPHIL